MAKNICDKIAQVMRGEVDFGPHKRTGNPYTPAEKLEEMLGVTEEVAAIPSFNENGEVLTVTNRVVRKHVDESSARDLNNIGPEAFGRSLMGATFTEQAIDAHRDPGFWPRISRGMRRVSRKGVTEMDSTGDTASMYEPINTWGSFTLGLYDFKVLEGYDYAPKIYEKLCPTVPSLIHGGQKHLRGEYDGSLPQANKPLAEGQAADTVGGKPMWVWSQPMQEFQLQWTISMEATMSDLSGGLARRGTDVGQALAKLENYRMGQVFLGYNNTYCFNTPDNGSPSCNTFLDGTHGGWAAAPPFNYVNLFQTNPLIDVDSLNTAYVNMLQLTDPARNWRMDLGKKFKLVVSPSLVFRAGEIVKAVTSYRASQLGLSPTTSLVGRVGEAANPLMIAGLDFEVVDMGMEWKDILSGGMNATNTAAISNCPQSWIDYQNKTANSSNTNPLSGHADAPGSLLSVTNDPTTGNADGFWMLLSEKHTFVQYEPWVPIRSEIWPLTGDELARRQAMRGGSYVASRGTVIEPRAAQVHIPLAYGSQ